jgi:hypothetical protein
LTFLFALQVGAHGSVGGDKVAQVLQHRPQTVDVVLLVQVLRQFAQGHGLERLRLHGILNQKIFRESIHFSFFLFFFFFFFFLKGITNIQVN